VDGAAVAAADGLKDVFRNRQGPVLILVSAQTAHITDPQHRENPRK
jgi:hypothetical protein